MPLVAMVFPGLMAAVAFLVPQVFRASVAHVVAQDCLDSQANPVHLGLLATTVNLALLGSRVLWVPRETLVPMELPALLANPGRMVTMDLLAALDVGDHRDIPDLKVPKALKEHLEQTVRFVALQVPPALLLPASLP